MWDLRRWGWWLWSPGFWRRVDSSVDANVSEILQPSRRRCYVSPNLWYPLTCLHGARSQRINAIFISNCFWCISQCLRQNCRLRNNAFDKPAFEDFLSTCLLFQVEEVKDRYLGEIGCGQTLQHAVRLSGEVVAVRVEPAQEAPDDKDECQTKTRHQSHRQALGARRYHHRHIATPSAFLSHNVTLTSPDHRFSFKVYWSLHSSHSTHKSKFTASQSN